MSSEPFRFKRRIRMMDWTQVEERIGEDDRNKWDRKAGEKESVDILLATWRRRSMHVLLSILLLVVLVLVFAASLGL